MDRDTNSSLCSFELIDEVTLLRWIGELALKQLFSCGISLGLFFESVLRPSVVHDTIEYNTHHGQHQKGVRLRRIEHP